MKKTKERTRSRRRKDFETKIKDTAEDVSTGRRNPIKSRLHRLLSADEILRKKRKIYTPLQKNPAIA